MENDNELNFEDEYQKALKFTLSQKIISSKALQEQLKVSYKIAAHLAHRLENNKVVSSEDKSGNRKVLAVLATPEYKQKVKLKELYKNIAESIQVIAFLSILGFMLYGLVSCVFFPETEKQKASRERRENELRYAILCQNMVKSELKHPSKADFNNLRWNWNEDDSLFIVTGEYEAMNGFGAMIPGYFSCMYDKDFKIISFNNK